MEKGRASKVGKAELLSSMITIYQKIKEREPANGFEAKSGCDLEKGLIGLIINSLEDEEDSAPLVEDEAMVVSRDVTSGLAADQFHHIQLRILRLHSRG